MQKEKKPQQVAKQIDQIKKEIELLNKDESLLAGILKKVKELIIQHHLGLVVLMYFDGSLYKLLTVLNNNYQRQKKKEMLQVLYMLFDLAIDCLFSFDGDYRKLLKAFNTKLPNMRSYKQFLRKQVIEEFQSFRKLMQDFMDLKNLKKIETYEKGLRLNEFLNNQLLKQRINSNFSNEVIMSWLRIQVSQIQASIYKEKSYIAGLCCKMHFQQNEIPFNIQYDNHAFINIIANQSKLFEVAVKQNKQSTVLVQVQNIKKRIVYFLNNEGGYIFLGVRELKAKQGIVNGIPLSKKQRFDYLKALQNAVITKIFPTDNQNQEQDQKDQDQRLKRFVKGKQQIFSQQVQQKYSHTLSELVDIDFLHIYNNKTLLFERDTNGNMLFIIRFRVKVGNPAQVYHFLNTKDLPEAFIEPNKSLKMIEYYDLVYSRIKDEANGKAVPKEPKTHALCLYSLKYEKKKVQVQPWSSDSEDNDWLD